MRFLFTIFLLIVTLTTVAQARYTVEGTIYNSDTKEILPGVSVGIAELPQQGDFTNESGKYKVTLPQGEYTLVLRLLGYYTKQIKIKLDKSKIQNADLDMEDVSLNEVEISAIHTDANIKGVQSGVDKLEIKTANKIPVLLGERDILKTIQLLPGIQTTGEGNTGFYVRGGNNDQNLILLDNATVYNPSHLFGFFSTFNSDAVNDITIYKGSMPAQYGGRLSSTLDVNMREGDLKNYTVTGGIGLISSRLTVEGPRNKQYNKN